MDSLNSCLTQPWLRYVSRCPWFKYLKISVDQNGKWTSSFRSVNNVLNYLQTRKINSLGTKRLHCYQIYRFSTYFQANPDRLVKSSLAKVEARIREFCDLIAGPERRARYANSYRSSLITFFRENGFRKERGRAIIVEPIRCGPRTRRRPEREITVEEAIRMASAPGVGHRDRAVILTLATTGLRNSTLRALKFGDVRKELEQNRDNLLLDVREDMKNRVPNACKGLIPYFVFTHKKATEAIRSWQEWREEHFGATPDDAPLFSSGFNLVPGTTRNLKLMSLGGLRNIVRDSAKKAGLENWQHASPQGLRRTFESFLRNQPARVRLDTKDQEFLFGHVLPGTQDAYYRANGKIEELRGKVSKLHLDTVEELRTLKDVSRAEGIEPDDEHRKLAEKLGREPDSSEEYENLKEVFRGVLSERNGIEQKIVTERELMDLPAREGWFVATSLPSGKIVVQRRLLMGNSNV